MGQPSALNYVTRKGRPTVLRLGTNSRRVLSGGMTAFYARMFASFLGTVRRFDCAFGSIAFHLVTIFEVRIEEA